MEAKTRKVVSLIGIASVGVCFAACLWLLFAAGCAGDAKGGALGNPARALQLESYAFITFVVALLAGTSIPFVYPRGSAAVRTALAVVFFALALVIWVVVGIQIEIQGVQSCFHS
jgi:hypothetical protein